MKTRFLFQLLIFATSMLNSSILAQQLAFPGAEGFGRYAKGVRAATIRTVYHVTNLNDSGTGSLRDAVSQPGRVVVFDVSGVIYLKSRLSFSGNSYVAGHTAPGDGIILYGNGVSFSGANDLIVRYLRIHMGKETGDSGKDASGIANGKGMIFDHVSVTWGLDENFSVNWDSKGTEPADITIQNSIIGQGIMSHSAGGLIQTDGGVSIIGCLYIDNKTRNPKVKGLNQFINNVVYNWGGGDGYILGGSTGSSWAWLEGNYFIAGPSGTTPFTRATTTFQLYQANNYVDLDKNGIADGRVATTTDFGSAGFVSTRGAFTNIPKAHPEIASGILSPQDALAKAIESVGASLPARSAVDDYLIDQLQSYGTKGSLIVHERANGIYNYVGVVSQGTKPLDTDNDGIPDAWEDANGLNKSNASDAVALASNGYLNIENYINSISAPVATYVRCASNLTMTTRTKSSIGLSWKNHASESDNILVQQSTDGTNFSTVATVAGTTTSHLLTGLEEERTYYYRLITTKSNLANSTPSEILKTATEGEPKIPYQSYSPTPAVDGTTRFYTSISLTWENETGPWAGTVTYDVYLGSSADNLTKIASGLTDNAYTYVSNLEMKKKYYWRVDATNTLGTTQGAVWAFTTGTYSFTSTLVDIGKDYDGATATTATSGIALSSSKTYTLNASTANEFLFTGSGTNIMNTGTSRGVYDNSANYPFFYISDDAYYVQGSVSTASEEKNISNLKINGTSADLDATAMVILLYSDGVGFNAQSIIGYDEVELPEVRNGTASVSLDLPTGTKSFRIYRKVTVSNVSEDGLQIGSGTNTQTLSGSGSPRIAYLAATLELTSNDDGEASSDNTIKSATINGKTAVVDNTNRTISAEFIKGTALGTFPVAFVLNSATATTNITSGATHDFAGSPLQLIVTAQNGAQATYAVTAAVSDKLTVGILTANGAAASYDNLLLSALSDYNVQFLDASATAPTDITTYYRDCDLVVLHASVAGTNTIGLASRQIVGVKPVLNMKAYFYSSGRWNWGTPSNTEIGRVSNTVATSLQNHPIFNGLTFTGENLTLYSSATTVVNAFQYVASPLNGTNWTADMTNANHTLATIDGNSGKVNIHELNTNNSAKYLLIGLSNEGNSYTLFNANAVALLKNAAAYLLNPNTYYDYTTNSTVGIRSNFSSGTLSYTGSYINNPEQEKVTVYNSLGMALFTSNNQQIHITGLNNGLYIARGNNNSVKFLYQK